MKSHLINIHLEFDRHNRLRNARMDDWPQKPFNAGDTLKLTLNSGVDISTADYIVISRFSRDGTNPAPEGTNPFSGLGEHFTFTSMMKTKVGTDCNDEPHQTIVKLSQSILIPYWDFLAKGDVKSWKVEYWVTCLHDGQEATVLITGGEELLPSFVIKVN